MILVFDTETTGLVKKGATFKDENLPRLVTLSYLLTDDNDYNVAEIYDVIVKPEGFIIPKESSDIHGVTHEMAVEKGVPLMEVLNQFKSALEKAHTLVAHNLDYDLLVMRGEFYKAGVQGKKIPNHFCTKEASTNLCKIPGNYGKFKWPTLTEACQILLGYTFDAHNSKNDTQACLKLFKYLQQNKK